MADFPQGGVEEKFKTIAQAYEVLSDPEERMAYDFKQRGFPYSSYPFGEGFGWSEGRPSWF